MAGRVGCGGLELCASRRYEGKTKGNIGVLMHVLPLVFVAAATCWEKHGAARFVYDTLAGVGGG